MALCFRCEAKSEEEDKDKCDRCGSDLNDF